VMNTLRGCTPSLFHGPIGAVLDHKSVVLRHFTAFLRFVRPVHWTGR
jgi:hypothetical protein